MRNHACYVYECTLMCGLSTDVMQLSLATLYIRHTGGENLFLEKFLELNEEELKKMQLSMHIRSSDDSEAFELLFLLLSRHKSPDGQSEQLDLDAVSGGPRQVTICT